MSDELTWYDVLRRGNIAGGDLETQENGNVYRGPISELSIKNGYVTIACEWIAKLDPDTGTWKNWPITSCGTTVEHIPQDISDNRIMFDLMGIGFGVIFPCGGSKLDPAKVEGLPPR